MLKKVFFSLFALVVCLQLYTQEKGIQAREQMPKWADIEGKEFFVFVDAFSQVDRADGSKKLPFKSIDEAFSFLSLNKKKHQKIKATINIKGSFATQYSYTITYPVKIVGVLIENTDKKKINSNINFGKNAAFIVTFSFLHLENLHITRKEIVNEPRTVPLLYSLSSNIAIKDTNIYVKEGGSACNFLDSNFSIIGSTITSKQNGYCSLIKATNSKGRISSSRFLSSARSIISFDATNSHITITNSNAELTSLYFAFFARVFDSTFFVLEQSSIVAKGSGKAKEAIIYNENSHINIQDLKIEGFEKEYSMKNGRLDYMK